MDHHQLILSFCMTCRDGHEAFHEDIRGGARLAQVFPSHIGAVQRHGFTLRGVRCMAWQTRILGRLPPPESATDSVTLRATGNRVYGIFGHV